MLKHSKSNGIVTKSLDKNILLISYYNTKAEECIEILHNFESSRLKDEAGFRWRIAKNKAELYGIKLFLDITPLEKIDDSVLDEISKSIERINNENKEMLKYDIKTSDLYVDTVEDAMSEYSNFSPEYQKRMEDEYSKVSAQHNLDNKQSVFSGVSMN